MDGWIILGVHALEFRVESFVACAGQAGMAFRDLGELIAFVEVREIVVAGQPGGCIVGDLVGLWSKQFVLNKAPEWFGISEVFRSGHGWADAGAQFLLVITTGEVVYLLGLWFFTYMSICLSSSSISALDKWRI